MQQFIRANREALRYNIWREMYRYDGNGGRGHIPDNPRDRCPLPDRELRLWILNDEGLYRWAKSEGVRI